MKRSTSIILAILALILVPLAAYQVSKQPRAPLPQPAHVALAAPKEPFSLLFPDNYHKQPAPLILWFHPAGEQTGNEKYLNKDDANVAAFLKAGYIVAGSNAHGQNWGSPTSQADTVYLYHYLTDHYKIGHVYFWAQSMGGLDSLLILHSGQIPVKAYIGMSVVTNLQAVSTNEHLAPLVKTQWPDKPSVPSPSDLHDYPKIPYLFFASDEDTWVVKADNVDKLDVRNKIVIATHGDHPDRDNFFQPDFMVQFLNGVEHP